MKRYSGLAVCGRNILMKPLIMVLIIAMMLAMAACTGQREEEFGPHAKQGEGLADYQYPANPAEQLRNALASGVRDHGFPLKIGEIENVIFEGESQKQIKIEFTNGGENICIVSFSNSNMEYGHEEASDAIDNPSFTIAFKEEDNSQDMVAVLTCIIQYLSPDLSVEEAEHLAEMQDKTISIDGYSMPQEIGGYQVQARYTNPHVFFRTREFDAKFGVTVNALEQIWGDVDISSCLELVKPQDYNVLTLNYLLLEEDKAKVVYADFIIKNIWQHKEWAHGNFWMTVDVESMAGTHHTLRTRTMRMFTEYEFGVGQRYTLYISLGAYNGAEIVYARQRSVSEKPASKGTAQPLAYSDEDPENRVVRIEPEGEGKIFNVYFSVGYSVGEPYAALEGHGTGEKQWPHDPKREGYAFAGWYDNEEGTGNPYSPDTPIYQDIRLYAKWKYIGPGGCWPRAYGGNIAGIEEGSVLSLGKPGIITVAGYNMEVATPKDQRFRWVPVMWRLSDGTNGSFSSDAPFEAALPLNSKGGQHLYITYHEEIFDGVGWQETNQLHEVEELFFWVESF